MLAKMLLPLLLAIASTAMLALSGCASSLDGSHATGPNPPFDTVSDR